MSHRRRRLAPLALGAVVALALPLPPAIPVTKVAGNPVVFTPLADTHIIPAKPDANFGDGFRLPVDSGPVEQTLLKFSVTGIGASPVAATLRLFNVNPATVGGFFYRVADNSWLEDSVTWDTAPAADPYPFAWLGPVSAEQWYEVDVSAMVTGDGVYSILITSPEQNGADYLSKEAPGGFAPQLIVTPTDSTDATPPSTPQNLTATAIGASAVDLSWSSSADDVGVTGYGIYRDGTLLATVQGGATTFTDPSVASLTTYSYTVDAFDAAGNHSAQSMQALVTTPAAAGDPVLTAAGDICGDCEPTARLVEAIDPTYALTLGDNQYQDGTLSEYNHDYGLSWGRFKAKTYPSAGNHDWRTANAQGYRDYFGARANPDSDGNTWYSVDVGNWHIIALDSNCEEVGGCGPGSPQYDWLQADLAADAHRCTMAYWHHPRFSSGTAHGGTTLVQPFWQLLFNDGAEIVLNGHEHNYERFGPQSPTGAPDARGVTEFVVGTGGAEHYPFGPPEPNSLARSSGTDGVLKLALHPSSYDFQFVPIPGKSFTESGSASCH